MVKIIICKFPFVFSCYFGNSAFSPFWNINIHDIITCSKIKEKYLIAVFFFFG